MLGLRLFAGLFAVSLIRVVAGKQQPHTKEESVLTVDNLAFCKFHGMEASSPQARYRSGE
jgi:hypothetical protein